MLEVDGACHDDFLQAAADRARNRKLTSADRVVVSCSAHELRHDPASVMEDLIALGVPRTGGRPECQKFLPEEESGRPSPAYRGGMARSDDFRMAPGDGLKYFAPEPDRDRQDREGGYVILALLVMGMLIAIATGHLTIFVY